eukprot:m.1341459 g.1341459  ORF g.1341459 m.1341459 type:complete len:121 (-) comp24895_c0_seq6:8440-8802(-)
MGLFGPKDGPLDWEKIGQIDFQKIEENDEIDKLEDLYPMIIRADPFQVDDVGSNPSGAFAVAQHLLEIKGEDLKEADRDLELLRIQIASGTGGAGGGNMTVAEEALLYLTDVLPVGHVST